VDATTIRAASLRAARRRGRADAQLHEEVDLVGLLHHVVAAHNVRVVDLRARAGLTLSTR